MLSFFYVGDGSVSFMLSLGLLTVNLNFFYNNSCHLYEAFSEVSMGNILYSSA
jgi:hypothetical protein